MKKITISASELLTFGGIEISLANKSISSLQNCEISLSGKITPLCNLILEDFMQNNKMFMQNNKMFLQKAKPSTNEKILQEINSEENKKLWAE